MTSEGQPGSLFWSCARRSAHNTFGARVIESIRFEPFSFFGQASWHDSISKTRVIRITA
jgi:hypothetical protein